jgi:iron complex outermembrane receptor protein
MRIQFLLLALLLTPTLYALNNILQMGLEDLSEIQIRDSSTTLTNTEIKKNPSSLVVITQKDIQESGARNLDELLEIYVPDLAYMHKLHGNQLGIGGIISDRNNKILLTLNGRTLNIKATDGGAVTERWFSMLGDIKQIKVISGPGSSIYGPGAIAGVINIETFNAESFDGFETTLKAGSGENFSSLDLKYATHFSNDIGLFLYGGLDNYNGSNENESVSKLAFDYPKKDIVANEKLPFSLPNINSSFEDEIRKKLHLQINYDNFEFWSRYTQSGMHNPQTQNLYTNTNIKYLQNTGAGNEQWSNSLTYTQKISRNFNIKYNASYISSKVKIINSDRNNSIGNRNWVENSTTLHILGNYTQNKKTSYALGAEYSYNRFGDSDSVFQAFLPKGEHWHTTMYSFFGEMQHRISDNLTSFLNIRGDKHTYSPWMFSPRVALVYSLDRNNLLKCNYSHSVRHADESDLYYNELYQQTKPDVEYIDRYEILYTKYSDALTFDAKASYSQHNVVSYNDISTPGNSEYIGEVTFYTLEAKLDYSTKNYSFFISHNYTKQLDFNLKDPNIQRQNISASPYGYGNDLANWNNHITKLRLNYNYSKKLKFINSLQIYWGMPGAIDLAHYNMDTFESSGFAYYRLPLYTDGTRAFEESVYFNSAVTYEVNKQMTLSLHGYNLLGLFNDDLNKRNYFKKTSHYIDGAPSIAFTFNYQLKE